MTDNTQKAPEETCPDCGARMLLCRTPFLGKSLVCANTYMKNGQCIASVPPAQGSGAGESVHNREHALELLDDTDSLIRFCSTHMMDVERYNRGSIAFWRVVHWIAAMPKNSDVAKSPPNTGNIVVGGVEYVPLEAYQEAMAGWKAATRLSQPDELLDAGDDWKLRGYPCAAAEIEDMANVGRALMTAIEKDYSGHSFMKNWHPCDCPTEIVGDLLNALDEAQAPEASEPKPWYETDAHRDLSRIIPDMEGKIAEAKIRFGHCLPANLFAPIEASITELRVLRHELAAIPAPEASEVEGYGLRDIADAAISNLEMALDMLAKAGRPQLAEIQRVYAANLRAAMAAHPPKASPMQELQAMGQEFDAVTEAIFGEIYGADCNAFEHPESWAFAERIAAAVSGATPPKVEASEGVTGEMLKAALLEEGGDAYMRNEGTPSHFLIDGIVDLDAVARSLAQPAPEQK